MTTKPRGLRRNTPARAAVATISMLLGVPGLLVASDVDSLSVVKIQRYQQFGSVIVSLAGIEGPAAIAPFALEAFIESPGPGLLTGANLQRPGGSELPLAEDAGLTNEWFGDEEFEDFAEFNAVCGNGSYTLETVGVNDGAKSSTVSLAADNYLGVTAFTVFESAQNIDAAADFTVRWDPIPTGTGGDPVFLLVRDRHGDVIFESAEPGEPGALDGLSTSLVLPGGTLDPAGGYTVILECYRIVDYNESYAPGVESLGAYGKLLLMEVRTAGAFDGTPPQLERCIPHDSESGVELDASVVFTFDEPMGVTVNPADAITWTGVPDPGGFTYAWSPDGTALFCNHGSGLPASTRVGWTLNPAGSSAVLRDVAGNPLPSGFAGTFETGTSGNPAATDIRAFVVGKARQFRQDSDATPETGHYFAGFFVDPNAAGRFTSVDLAIPGRGIASDVGQVELDYWETEGETTFAEKADLDRIFPNGGYTFTMHTINDGDQVVTLDLGADDYPSVPRVANFAATQAIDPGQPFTLQWDAMIGGTVDDVVEIYIEGDPYACFFETPETGEPGALDGTVASVTIPANTLPPGRTLICEVTFVRISDSDDTQYPGVPGRAGFFVVNTLEIVTTGTPFRPVLGIVRDGPAAIVTVTGERGRQYEISASEDLENWTPVRTQHLSGEGCLDFRGSFEAFDFVSGAPVRFYQASEVTDEP